MSKDQLTEESPPGLDSLPPACQTLVARAWSGLDDDDGLWLRQRCQEDAVFRERLYRSWVASDFFAEHCASHGPDIRQLFEQGLDARDLSLSDMVDDLAARLAGVEDEAALHRGLRCFRRLHQLRLIHRNANQMGGFETLLGEISQLAQTCILAALNWCYAQMETRHGTPVGSESGEPQSLLVIAMGKLGAGELNLSSDIDLIFAYPESGKTAAAAGQSQLENQVFFVRLGQQVIKALEQSTADGFVYRVDMRLRPFGGSGALAWNFTALEHYYQTHGRDWERYAMVKARVLNGRPEEVAELEQILRPFTYRRYIDFSAIDALRDMKALIQREEKRRRLGDNVKLGAGGIREVEFIVQAFQLIRGGRDARLRDPRLLRLLPQLEEEACLPVGAAARLRDDYTFLRNTEHALQALRDKQTQQLPDNESDLLRIALTLGFSDGNAFLQALDEVRASVRSYFAGVVAEPRQQGSERDAHRQALYEALQVLWLEGDSHPAQALGLDAHHLVGVVGQLDDFRSSRPVISMQAQARNDLDALMPLLLENCFAQEDVLPTLGRILVLLAAIVRRPVYLQLLLENLQARKHLVSLCGASPWIAEQVSEHPALLDELIDPRSLFSVPDREGLAADLRQQVLRIDSGDLETQMELLRYFKLSHSLRVAACDVAEVLPLMKVSDQLTWLAEVILEHALGLAWQQLVARHGAPRREIDGLLQAVSGPEFAIIAYGKLGGLELGYASDLDLVFVYDAEGSQSTDGDKPLDPATFYTRLGQRLIHIVTTQTSSGPLYEVDMRLRPSGNSGLLVSSFNGFAKYQSDSAWTWEHQALVRARAITGSAALMQRVEALRLETLCRDNDVQKLHTDVVDMREKMRSHLAGKSEVHFDLKQDAGGIVDIEFMVQYCALKWAATSPALLRYSDNIRIIEALECAGFLDPKDAQQLTEAYKAYRAAGHREVLHGRSRSVDAEQFAAQREAVTRLWQKLVCDDAIAVNGPASESP